MTERAFPSDVEEGEGALYKHPFWCMRNLHSFAFHLPFKCTAFKRFPISTPKSASTHIHFMLSMQRPSPRVVTDSKVMEKTHQRGPKEVEWLSQVAAEVEAATSPEEAGLVVRRYFDLDSLINITAMNYALGAWDTWLNSFNNNYWCAYCSEAPY